MSRRGLLAGFGALAATGALTATGCSTTTPGASSSGAAETDTINFYGSALGEGAQKAAWLSIIKGWEKKTGKKVKPVVWPYDQVATQLMLAAKSGELEGVSQGTWQVLVPTGALADLSDIAARMDLPDKIIDAFRIDGKLYFVPLSASGIGMVSDGRIASEVGLTAGAMSIEKFAAALEKIKKQDPKLIPYAAVTKNPDLKDAVHWMWGWGSEVVTDDARCTIGDAESVAAMKWYKHLQDAGLTKAGMDRSTARILFAKGQTVLYDDAPLANSFARTNGAGPELIAAMQPLLRPAVKGHASYNRYWGNVLFCSKGKGEKTSKDFISYVTSDVSAATALYKGAALGPADPTIAKQIPSLAKDHFQTGFKRNISAHARVAAWDKLTVTAQMDTTIGEGVASILAGQTSVQSGLNALRKKVQDILDQNA
ncbi:ABC transporter substrate-binding protein [Streptomyces sp. NPDC001228]|uniref:ABC transporter substrate-binding protein n=1 Tax=unclassified Streptomyces TaxID=2593676 RepID=UPI003319C245